MKKEYYPLNYVYFCEYVDNSGKYNCRAFLIKNGNEVVLLDDYTKVCQFVQESNPAKKTLSYMLKGDYSLASRISFYPSYDFFDKLVSRVETSNTKLAKKLEKVKEYLDYCYDYEFKDLTKDIFISDKKLKKYLNELEVVENALLQKENERKF